MSAQSEPTIQDVISAKVTGAEIVSFRATDDALATCPVQALGERDGIYFFVSQEGELRRLSARDFTDRQIISLFSGDIDWLVSRFPELDRKGSPSTDDFNAKNATRFLMRACHMMGLFNVDTPLRGVGVWRIAGSAALHAGDAVWMDGGWLAPGRMIGDALYVARPKVERPEMTKPLDDFETKKLRKYVNAWAFHDSGDADLLFGWLGAALLGGFPSWRAHAVVVGSRGTGKSSLGGFLTDCLGPQGTSMNNYTEAGLRQSLQNEARAIWLDEAESSGGEGGGRMGEVIKLLRLLSGGKGAQIVRGSSGGVAQSTTVTGCVLLTAVNPPHLEAQDRSRILEITLDIPESNITAESDLGAYRADAVRMSAGLRARALLRADHFAAVFSVFRRVLVSQGCDGRQADLFSTLLAGRSILLDPSPPDSDQVRNIVAQYQARLNVIMIEDREASDGRTCLNTLFDYLLDVYRNSQKITIGQMIASMLADVAINDEAMQSFGIRLLRSEGMPELFIPHEHVQLKRVFAGTVWAQGGWTKSIARLPDIHPSPNPVRVAGQKRRGLLIPFSYLPHNTETSHDPPHPPFVS